MLKGGVTACLVLLLLSALPHPAPAASSPPYLLTPAEMAALRDYEGKYALEAVNYVPGRPILRVVKHIAGKRGGKYSGNNWSVFEHFVKFVNGPPDYVAIEQNRYLIGSGCRQHSCSEKTAFVVDLQTGHLAFALLHYFTAENRYLDSGPALTQFMKTCANRELRTFAAVRFKSWAEGALARYKYRIEILDEAEGKTLTTAC